MTGEKPPEKSNVIPFPADQVRALEPFAPEELPVAKKRLVELYLEMAKLEDEMTLVLEAKEEPPKTKAAKESWGMRILKALADRRKSPLDRMIEESTAELRAAAEKMEAEIQAGKSVTREELQEVLDLIDDELKKLDRERRMLESRLPFDEQKEMTDQRLRLAQVRVDSGKRTYYLHSVPTRPRRVTEPELEAVRTGEAVGAEEERKSPTFEELEEIFGKGNVSDFYRTAKFEPIKQLKDQALEYYTEGDIVLLFQPSRDGMASEEIIAKVDAEGWRPMMFEEFIDYVSKHPDAGKKEWVICLGSSAGYGDDRCVAVLFSHSGRRVLVSNWFENEWYSVRRFLFVRKSRVLGPSDTLPSQKELGPLDPAQEKLEGRDPEKS